MPSKRILLLGGTAEAADLARRLAETLAAPDGVIVSLAGLVKPRRPLPCPMRVGGFGGVEGLETYLQNEEIGLVVDATHPFAATISAHARQACDRTRIPRLTLARPPWTAGPGDAWQEVESFEGAAAALSDRAQRALLALGRRRLTVFAGLTGIRFTVRLLEHDRHKPSHCRDSVYVVNRPLFQKDRADSRENSAPRSGFDFSRSALAAPADPLPLADYEVITGHPPYSLEEERRLMQEKRIDTLVIKQSGGAAGQAKLTAARELGVHVILVARPEAEPGECVATADEALAWITGSARPSRILASKSGHPFPGRRM